MSKGFKLRVWGDYACFTRPELKSERVSYEVMTPSAAIGILSAIYWKPQICWRIDRIHVLNPIYTIQVRRNELEGKIPSPKAALIKEGGEAELGIYIEKDRKQRASTILKKVDYVIEAHFNLCHRNEEDKLHAEAKHAEIFHRRASRGQCFHQPYFGNREFPVNFELLEDDFIPESHLPEDQKNRPLGMMLHEIVYIPDKKGKIKSGLDGSMLTARPHFFRAELKDGILEVPSLQQTVY